MSAQGPGGELAYRGGELAYPLVIATDFDGTLLRSDGTLSARTTAAIAAWEDAGGLFIVVTARPPRWMHPYRGQIGNHPLVICGNGAFVYDLAATRVVEEHVLSTADVDALVADLRVALPGVGLAVERATGISYEPAFAQRGEGAFLPAECQVPSVAGAPAGKLLARRPGMSSRDLLAVVSEVVGERGIVAYSGAVGLAEVTAPGVTKGAALQRWSVEHGVRAEQVWAFGDMFNDLPMLAWAGRGLAVANAAAEVRAAAHEVCPANDEDGVAQVIERLLRR